MRENKQTVAAPKTVSADTKRKSLALPISFNTLKDLRKVVDARPDHTPRDLFVFLIGDKDICTKAVLKEMFGLDDRKLTRVFYENQEDGERDYHATDTARWILTRVSDLDEETGNIIPLHFTSGQEKLRALLVKCINVSRYESFMEELEEEYGIDILYDYYDDVREDNTITEEELLDALLTYQTEHQA